MSENEWFVLVIF